MPVKWVNSTSHIEVRKIIISAVYRKNVHAVALVHNGRALEKASIEVTYNEHYSEIPKASRMEYTFDEDTLLMEKFENGDK